MELRQKENFINILQNQQYTNSIISNIILKIVNEFYFQNPHLRNNLSWSIKPTFIALDLLLQNNLELQIFYIFKQKIHDILWIWHNLRLNFFYETNEYFKPENSEIQFDQNTIVLYKRITQNQERQISELNRILENL